MPSITPNEAEESFLLAAWKNGEDFFIGLISDLPTALDALGEGLVFADLTQVTNLIPTSVGGVNGAAVGDEWRITGGTDITVPTGASAGNDATHPQIEFEADTGGASAGVSGYYVRTTANVLRVVITDPQVVSSGTLRVMNEGAKFRVDPALGAE